MVRLRLLIALASCCILGQSAPSLVPSAPSPCNASIHFDCQRGRIRCVPLEWMCDNVPDCENGQDEMSCHYLHDCPTGSMICRTAECVANKFKCDGEWDCQKGEDEKFCGQIILGEESDSIPAERKIYTEDDYTPAQKCESPKFLCSSGQCLTQDAVCDGYADCPEKEDEANCTKRKTDRDVEDDEEMDIVCKADTVACANKYACIPSRWICDGEQDCEDGSDEADCKGADMRQQHIIDGSVISDCTVQGMFRCRTVNNADTCIFTNLTCNGISDCPEGDDESELCNECRDKGCSHQCDDTPYGGICSCPVDKMLSADKKTCIEVDECIEYGHLCQQYCEDRPGRYECKCASGYMLDKDGHSCKLDNDQEGFLYLSLGFEIRSMPLFNAVSKSSAYDTMHKLDKHGFARSIAYNTADQTVFMAIDMHNNEGEIGTLKDGIFNALRENVTGVGYVAVDWTQGNIYFTQKYPAPRPGISVCTRDGFFCRQIISGQATNLKDSSARQSYRGLALHPQAGRLVWIDSYRSIYKIMIANLDGTNAHPLVENKLSYPSGLAVDPIRNEVYFGDVEEMVIERVDIHGANRRTILTMGVSHPYDLAFFNGQLYWTDWGSDTLKVADLSEHHQTTHIIHSFTRFPYGIAINHTMYQPTLTSNPCSPDVLACSWICVAIPSTTAKQQLEARCLCPDGYTTDSSDCVPLPSNKRPKGLSYVGTSYMKSFCNAETSLSSGCMNGGSCEEVKNAYGRTERIVCKCEPPYTGDHCERYDYGLDEAEKLVEREESSRSFPFFLFFLLLILIAVGFTYFYITNREFNNKIHQLGNKIHQSASNLPPPPYLSNIRDYAQNVTRNITRPSWSRGTSPRSGSGFSRQSPQRSARSGGPTDGNASTSLLVDNYLSPSAYSNPMYNETVVYSTPPDSESESPSSLLPTSSPSPADPRPILASSNPLIHSSQNVY